MELRILRLGVGRDAGVTPWEEGCRGEKNSRVKGLGSPALDDLLGGKKRVLLPVDR